MDTSTLVALKAKLDADFDALIAAAAQPSIDASKVAAVLDSGSAFDAAVVDAAVPVQGPTLNLDAFKVSANKLAESFATVQAGGLLPSFTQAVVDSLVVQMDRLQTLFNQAFGIQ